MLSNLSVDELPKKIAFTANLGIIQYLKNKKQEAFLNLQKVKSLIQVPESSGISAKSSKLKSTDLLDQLNNMAVFEYLQGSNDQGLAGIEKYTQNPQKPNALDACIKILEEARGIIQSSNCNNSRSELSILNNLAIFQFLNKNYT